MSDDLYDHAEILSFEDCTTKTVCAVCIGECSVDWEGNITPSPECTGECEAYELIYDKSGELNFE